MRPLNGEDEEIIPPPFTYTLWGTSRPFWVLLTEGKRLSSSLIRPLLSEAPDLDLTEVAVDVVRLVNVVAKGGLLAIGEIPKVAEIPPVGQVLATGKLPTGDKVPGVGEIQAEGASTDKERKWFLTTVHARTPEFRDALRTISVYGESLPGASLFKDALPLLVPTSAGLRLEGDKHELGTISSGGTLTVSGTRRFGQVDDLLDDIVAGGYTSG